MGIIYHKGLLIALICIVISCTPQRRIAKESGSRNSIPTSCDSLKEYKSLYISKINADIQLDKQNYSAKVSFYYLPDSIMYASAINSGFEILRIGVTKDSIVYINRLDKLVFIFRNSKLEYPPPINFSDLEVMINRLKLCTQSRKKNTDKKNINIDLSERDIDKRIIVERADLMINKFEFFQKKTSEYIVGERSDSNDFIIYSNFIVDDLMLKVSGGDIEYNKRLKIDLDFNRTKYDIVYL